MKKLVFVILILVLVGVLATTLSSCRWVGTYVENRIDYVDQKIDDRTNYDTLKTVEDSCRAMIASYEADKLTWIQYKDSEDSEQRSWADQAKMRANRTASNYNNYILKNSYVWDGNIPEDIRSERDIMAAKVYSKLCPRLTGYILRWIDADQFIASITGRDGKETEMVCHRQYWEVSTV